MRHIARAEIIGFAPKLEPNPKGQQHKFDSFREAIRLLDVNSASSSATFRNSLPP